MRPLFRALALTVALLFASASLPAQAALNTHLSDTTANAQAVSLATLCNTGTIQIYTGTQPANANTAVSTQTLLVTLTFGSTAFGAPSGGVLTANSITAGTAVATGTATWYRVLESNGTTVVMDGSVATSGANLNLSTTSIVSGVTVSVSSFTHTVTE